MTVDELRPAFVPPSSETSDGHGKTTAGEKRYYYVLFFKDA